MNDCTPEVKASQFQKRAQAPVVEHYAAAIKAGKGTVLLSELGKADGDPNYLIRPLQCRAAINHDVVDDYGSLMKGGRGRGNKPETFPPVRIFSTGQGLFLTSGAHRWAAADQIGLTKIDAEFFTGTYEDALLDAVTQNAKHGLRPNRADIRHTLEMLFQHASYRQKSDTVLAKLVGCSITTVGDVRKKLNLADDGKRVDAKGRTIDTSKIGRKPKADKPPLSKLECEAEVPLCTACEMRNAVDGERCQDCIDAGKTAADLEPLPPAEDEQTEDDEVDPVAGWNTRVEQVARKITDTAEIQLEFLVSNWLDNDRLGRISALVRKIADELRAIKCHAVCPKCEGNGSECEYCRNEGIVPRSVFDSLEAGQ